MGGEGEGGCVGVALTWSLAMEVTPNFACAADTGWGSIAVNCVEGGEGSRWAGVRRGEEVCGAADLHIHGWFELGSGLHLDGVRRTGGGGECDIICANVAASTQRECRNGDN